MPFRLFALPLLALTFAPISPLVAQTETPVARQAPELRGLWVVRDALTSPESIRRVVTQAKAHRFNALFVQVRGRGDAFYLSSLEPRAEELANAPQDYDPLAEMLRQAHAAGLQVHAWLNTCYVWGAGRRPSAASHVVNRHPDWLDRDAHGNYRLTAGPECEGAFLSPANLQARQHIHDVFLDVARRYDIDGIHFDYVRYPSGVYDYSDAALTRFRAEIEPTLTERQKTDVTARLAHDRLAYPHLFNEQWKEFRRRQVTEMVGQIAQDVRAAKPWVVLSAAVFADSRDALNARGQDWKTWLQRGYLDAVVPMAYGSSTPRVAAQIADAVRCAHAAGRDAYAGIGSWHIPAASTLAKIDASRTLGAEGFVLFSYGGVTRDGATQTYLDKVAAHCPGEAAVPTMSWLGARPTAGVAGEPAEGFHQGG